ncbi:MAG: hypothetical protein KIT09_21320 [Bryobacteraceae bacterium]|nr:hypothetical protein [Bryobacteraceae bacterium]
MRSTRRAFVLGSLGGSLGSALRPGRPEVLVVSSASAEAYGEAIARFQSSAALRDAAVSVAQLAGKDLRAPLSVALAAPPRLVVTMGSNAFAAVLSFSCDTPVLASLVLRSDVSPAVCQDSGRSPVVATLSMEVQPAAFLPKLKRIFPGKDRLAIAWNSAAPAGERAEIAAEARRQGYRVDMLECASPKDLLGAPAALRRQADFLWCLPDRALHRPETVAPLILASIRNHVPIIGFSENFARAGALLAVYADYGEAGEQAAELAARYLEHARLPPSVPARGIRIAINERLLRVLGLEVDRRACAEFDVRMV